MPSPRKLTSSEAALARHLRSLGYTFEAIARRFSNDDREIDPSAIHQICSGRNYRQPPPPPAKERLLTSREAWLASDLFRIGYSPTVIARWLSHDDREVEPSLVRAIVHGRTYLEMRPREFRSSPAPRGRYQPRERTTT